MKKHLTFLLILVFTFLTSAAVAAGFCSNPKQINDAALSVLMLEVYDKDNQLLATGSGFCAFSNRYLVTNAHVIEGADYVFAYSDIGDPYMVSKVLALDVDKDIAICQFFSPTDLKPLELDTDGGTLRAEPVVAIGSPQGLTNTVSMGNVSALYQGTKVREIQFTAPISSGSSGGALFNDEGQVIGITSSTLKSDRGNVQNINFAVDIQEVLDLYDRYSNTQAVPFAQMGEKAKESAERLVKGNRQFAITNGSYDPDSMTLTVEWDDSYTDRLYDVYIYNDLGDLYALLKRQMNGENIDNEPMIKGALTIAESTKNNIKEEYFLPRGNYWIRVLDKGKGDSAIAHLNVQPKRSVGYYTEMSIKALERDLKKDTTKETILSVDALHKKRKEYEFGVSVNVYRNYGFTGEHIERICLEFPNGDWAELDGGIVDENYRSFQMPFLSLNNSIDYMIEAYGEVLSGEYILYLYTDGRIDATQSLLISKTVPTPKPTEQPVRPIKISSATYNNGQLRINVDKGTNIDKLEYYLYAKVDEAITASGKVNLSAYQKKAYHEFIVASPSSLVTDYLPLFKATYWIVAKDSRQILSVYRFNYSPSRFTSFDVSLDVDLKIKRSSTSSARSFTVANIEEAINGGQTRVGAYIRMYNELKSKPKSKELEAYIVLHSPDGNMYPYQPFAQTYKRGSYEYWDFFDMTDAFKSFYEAKGSVPKGVYRLALYLDGAIAAESKIEVK